MGKASNKGSSKPLLTGITNNNNKIKTLRLLSRGIVVSMSSALVFFVTGVYPNNLLATEVRVQHCKDNRYEARQYRKAQKKQQRQQKKHRLKERQHRTPVKQKFKTPNKHTPVKVKAPIVVQKVNKPQVKNSNSKKTVVKLDDNTKLKIKQKGDKTKLIIVKKKPKSDRYTDHDKHRPNKTVIHFDESGLIGYRTNKNSKVILDQPIPKNGFVKKLESKFGNLEKVRIKEKPNKLRVVGVFQHRHNVPQNDVPQYGPQQPKRPNTKPITAEPIQSPVSTKPQVTPGAEYTLDISDNVQQQPIVIQPTVQPKATGSSDTPSVSQQVVNQPSTPFTEPVIQTTSTNVPSITAANISVSSEVAPTSVATSNNVQPRSQATGPNLIVQSSNSINPQQNTIQVSISQPIVGRSNPEQPINSLNLGGTSSLPQTQQPTAEPIFNARIAQEGESLEDKTSDGQKMPYHQVAYVDVNSLSETNHLFGSIGRGISMNIGQCEQIEGCTTQLDSQQLGQLKLGLEAKVSKLQQQLSATDSEKKRTRIARTLAHVSKKLERVIQLQNVAIAYAQIVPEAKTSKPENSPSTYNPVGESRLLADNKKFDITDLDTSIFEDLSEEISDD